MTEHQKELAVERLIRRVQQLDEAILEIIGKRIAQIGSFNQAELYQVQQMLKYGADLKKIEEYIARVTKLNVKDIRELFEIEAKDNYEFAKQFYQAKNVPYIPYEQNIALQEQVKAIAEITANEYLNISGTLGFTLGKNGFKRLEEGYKEIIDRAVLATVQGKESYQSAISDTLKQLADSGIRTINWASGYHRRADSQVRMNVLDGMRRLDNELQERFGKEYGADGVEISVHSNPAPDHADVQGRQFTKQEYQRLQETGIAVDITGHKCDLFKGKSFRPISTMNCYHRIFNIVVGVSKPLYSQKELKEIREKNQQGFEYEGKHYTNYEGTQLLRRIETATRKERETLRLGEASKDQDMILGSQRRIALYKKKYKAVVRVSGLRDQFATRSIVKF